MKSHILNNTQLSAEILIDWGYTRSRYDWGGTVKQVKKEGHTFISREERSDGSFGLGGVGLTNVFEWEDTSIYDKAAIADKFPLLGVGLCAKGDTLPFLFTKDYSVTPFQRIIEADNTHVSIRTLPHMVFGTAVDMEKTFTLDGSTLIVSFNIKNVGSEEIRAHEFCHNFMKFDGHKIDSSYKVSFPYSIQVRMRRGQILLERDAYRIGEMDAQTESSAYWLHGWEGMQSHWMKIENSDTNTAVLVEDNFPPCGFYVWNNENACCPEVYAPIYLRSGESVSYERKYTFYT